MILLDTVILSELRKNRPSPKVVQWLKQHQDSDFYLSVVSLGEIERGIEKKRKTEPDFAHELTRWLEDLQRLYANRVLPITAPIARKWGQLSAQLGHDGADLLIASTALVHGLTVATRNTRHFEKTHVQLVNPFNSI
jgi:toxin FitB